MKKRSIFVLMLLWVSLMLFSVTASAATITNMSDGDTVVKGKTVTVYIKPGCYYYNGSNHCFLKVFDAKNKLVFNGDKSYTDMYKKLKFTFIPNSTGTYTLEEGTYSEGGTYSQVSTISLTVTTASKIKADKPTVTGSANGNGKVALTIKGLGNKYDVYRATSASGKYTKLGTSSDRTFTDSKAKQRTYYYKVKGKVGSYATKMSSYVKVNAKISAVKVKFSLKLDNESHVVVNVTSTPYSKGYMIYRSESKNGTYKLVKTMTGHTFTDTSVGDKTYYYKIKPYASVNGKKTAGKFSVAKSIAVNNPDKPGKPVITIAEYKYTDGTVKTGAVSISFKQVVNAAKYIVNYSTDGGKTYYPDEDWGLITAASLNGEDCVDRCYLLGAIYSGKTIYFKLEAVNGDLKSMSDSVSFKIP